MAGCPATWNAHLPGGDKLEEKNALINAGIEMSSLKKTGHVWPVAFSLGMLTSLVGTVLK
ncbi:hypothetical protein B4100_2015 [Heyndrickxia coagulans]|jgi:hypothetical protein|nr:hypothetical protein B4100_2015 [Heyndrickxia coagulans]